MKHWPVALVALLAFVFPFALGCDNDSVMPDSGPVAATPERTAGGVPTLTLYAMSECPFGVPAEFVVHKVKQVLGDKLNVRLVFIVGQTANGELTSLHGPTEVEKDMIQACVGKLAPAKQLDFTVQMNQGGQDWQTLAGQMGIDASAVQTCLTDGNGKQLLLADLQETEKLGVNASPTIIINDARYSGGMNSREIFDAACNAYAEGEKPPVCDQPPEILSRSDGSGAGSCGPKPAEQPLPEEMIEKSEFVHTVVYDANAIDQSRIDEVLKQTLRIYPNAKVEKVDAGSRAGKKLVEQYELTLLPAFIFPKKIETFKNFQHMERYLKKIKDIYLLDPKIGGNVQTQRERKPKTVDIFYSPFSTKAMRVLLDVHDLLTRPDMQALKVTINLRPYGMFEAGMLITQMGPPELEEMQRVLTVVQLAPDKIWQYIKLRYENPASSWWEDYITQIGLDPAAVKKLAQSDEIKKQLEANSHMAADFSIADEIVFVIENRELARLEGKDQFRKMLESLGTRNQ